MAWIDQLNTKVAEAARRRADPYRETVQTIMRDKEQIGTAPLLDLLGMAKTTGNARRMGQTMRSLGFVPLKSRRLMPGGYRDTVTRGWTRTFKSLNARDTEPREATPAPRQWARATEGKFR